MEVKRKPTRAPTMESETWQLRAGPFFEFLEEARTWRDIGVYARKCGVSMDLVRNIVAWLELKGLIVCNNEKGVTWKQKPKSQYPK